MIWLSIWQGLYTQWNRSRSYISQRNRAVMDEHLHASVRIFYECNVWVRGLIRLYTGHTYLRTQNLSCKTVSASYLDSWMYVQICVCGESYLGYFIKKSSVGRNRPKPPRVKSPWAETSVRHEYRVQFTWKINVGSAGVHLTFLYLLKNKDCEYIKEPLLLRLFKRLLYVWSANMKKIYQKFSSENSHLKWEFSDKNLWYIFHICASNIEQSFEHYYSHEFHG